MVKLKEKHYLFLVCLLAFLARVLIIPQVQVVDADATSRIFIAEGLLDHFRLLYEGVWLPLHYYLIAISIFITGEHFYGPMLLHSLLAVLTAIPIYFFTKRELNPKGALFASAIYLFIPVVFRNSFHALAGIPCAFFVAHGINLLSKGLKANDLKLTALAGLMMTLAGGFRYESWVLIAIFTGILLFKKSWQHLFTFWVISVFFPAFWMIGNYIAHQDFFYGLSGAYYWNIIKEGVNDHVSFNEKILRIIFFPLSWAFNYSPIIVTLLAYVVYLKRKVMQKHSNPLLWLTPFIVMLLIFIVKSYEGTLLMQHRFSISLVLLSVPFSSYLFSIPISNRKGKIIAILLVVSLSPLSYFWLKLPIERLIPSFKVKSWVSNFRYRATYGFEAIPQLANPVYREHAERLKQSLGTQDGLIIDFTSWEETYFLALYSGLKNDQIYLADGAMHNEVKHRALEQVLKNYDQGIILLVCNSSFSKTYQINNNILTFNRFPDLHLKLELISSDYSSSIFTYNKTTETMGHSENSVDCPEPNSLAHYIGKIYRHPVFLNEAKKKAAKEEITLLEAIQLNAKRMQIDDQERN